MDRFAFPLTDEQSLLYELVRDFARERVAPTAAARDQSHAYPTEELAEAGALGLLAAKVPEDSETMVRVKQIKDEMFPAPRGAGAATAGRGRAGAAAANPSGPSSSSRGSH